VSTRKGKIRVTRRSNRRNGVTKNQTNPFLFKKKTGLKKGKKEASKERHRGEHYKKQRTNRNLPKNQGKGQTLTKGVTGSKSCKTPCAPLGRRPGNHRTRGTSPQKKNVEQDGRGKSTKHPSPLYEEKKKPPTVLKRPKKNPPVTKECFSNLGSKTTKEKPTHITRTIQTDQKKRAKRSKGSWEPPHRVQTLRPFFTQKRKKDRNSHPKKRLGP